MKRGLVRLALPSVVRYESQVLVKYPLGYVTVFLDCEEDAIGLVARLRAYIREHEVGANGDAVEAMLDAIGV